MTMNIKRDVIAQGADLDALRERIKQEAETRGMGPSNDRNDHGPIYINAQYDLRIERDPGNWGQYRLMLLHKLQPKTSFWGKLKRG